MNRIVIVPAAGEHIPALAELLHTLDTPDFSYAIFEEIDTAIRAGRYFIALQAGEPAGVIGLAVAEQSCQIEVVVSRRPGTGRALVDFARAWAVAQGARKLWCWSLARYATRGFYEKCGFTECHLLRRQWFGEDCYYFGMPLADRVGGEA